MSSSNPMPRPMATSRATVTWLPEIGLYVLEQLDQSTAGGGIEAGCGGVGRPARL